MLPSVRATCVAGVTCVTPVALPVASPPYKLCTRHIRWWCRSSLLGFQSWVVGRSVPLSCWRLSIAHSFIFPLAGGVLALWLSGALVCYICLGLFRCRSCGVPVRPYWYRPYTLLQSFRGRCLLNVGALLVLAASSVEPLMHADVPVVVLLCVCPGQGPLRVQLQATRPLVPWIRLCAA
jgi:hypothetical protein